MDLTSKKCMIKFDHCYYKEEDTPKIFFSLDWFSFEDRWTQRYMFDRPMWKDDEMESIKLRNENRHKWFTIRLNVMNYHVNVEFKGKKVGNLNYGRQMNDIPKLSLLRKKK